MNIIFVLQNVFFRERDGIFDWETLLDKETAAKHRIAVKERLLGNHEHKHKQNLLEQPIKIKQDDDDDDIETQATNNENNQENFIEEPWIIDTATERAKRLQSNAALNSMESRKRRNHTLFIAIVGTCCAVGLVGIVGAAIFWYKVQQKAATAGVSEYPSYGVTGPNPSGSKMSPSSTMSDRKLAQSAQMFHYQQQRQQMMAQEKDHLDAKQNHSDDSDDEAPAGGDYTVYECPGLAPTGEMEVRNPLFAEPDSSLISPLSSAHPATNNHYPQLSTSPPKEKSLP